MGKTTPELLQATGIAYMCLMSGNDIQSAEEKINEAFSAQRSLALLLPFAFWNTALMQEIQADDQV